ncbi:MAG: hypothetical protein A2Y20_06520 [Firmicutes bacterium GWF2_51_9]|nr:MAG: hypothetical protein A2Y20_06520 [Firmicutes bacterium GWF2_51_9]OGS59748.1 MAG: hypothetical protein A2Y19_06860 [Firmicutes bacterium GWE2_51_13]HAM62268.1 hypothetical protein [Erysipelotrichaceae bacterium]HBZ42363.1 hypothetical protein [Erysipelotrichaceae bacterium]
MKKQNINLMEGFSAIEKRRSQKSDRVIVFMALFLSVFLIVGAFSFKLYLDNSNLKDKIKVTEAYVNDPILKARIAAIEVSQAKINDLNQIDQILDELNASFEVFPRINTLSLRVITSNMPTGTSLKSLAFDGQWFTIQLISPNYSGPSQFAVSLRDSEFFEEVIYQGYTSEVVNGVTRYVGKVVAILKVGD